MFCANAPTESGKKGTKETFYKELLQIFDLTIALN